MDRTINIPNADNAFLEMLAEKMGWTISPATSTRRGQEKAVLGYAREKEKSNRETSSHCGYVTGQPCR